MRIGYSNALVKIDDEATLGLSGTDNSLAYRVNEIERHVHSYERWLESAAVPSGETHVADQLGNGGGSFQVDAGNNDWGTWVQIVGSADTPVITGSVKFDLHRIIVTAAERNFTYYMQVSFGTSGAVALAAGAYTENIFLPASNQVDSGPVLFQSRREDAGTKVWARVQCPGQDTGTINFCVGIHEYEG